MTMLPKNATTRSNDLFATATEIASLCPTDLADAIGIVGSVSRGVADKFSDIDLVFWVKNYPTPEACRRWLSVLDVHELRPGLVRTDGRLWFEYQIKDVLVNLMWESWDYLNQAVQIIQDVSQGVRSAAGDSYMEIAWTLSHAIVLRNHRELDALRRRISVYPEPLRHRVIHDILGVVKRMIHVPVKFAAHDLIFRGEVMDLKRRQMMSIDAILALLFAYNRVWRPDNKWLISETQRLAKKPDNLLGRINNVLNGSDGLTSVHTLFSLWVDALGCLEPEFAVQELKASLQNMLDFNPFEA